MVKKPRKSRDNQARCPHMRCLSKYMYRKDRTAALMRRRCCSFFDFVYFAGIKNRDGRLDAVAVFLNLFTKFCY